MRLLTQIAAAVTAFGVIAGAVVLFWDLRQDTCESLLRWIQRDLRAARIEYRDAFEKAPKLTDPDAIAINDKILYGAEEDIEEFEQRRDKERAECSLFGF